MFPRFYFIGDDDLLEILGQATNPLVIQTHLKKLFAGIHSVEFDADKTHIMAMKSLDGEVVNLRNKIQITNKVEVNVLICIATSDCRQNGYRNLYYGFRPLYDKSQLKSLKYKP